MLSITEKTKCCSGNAKEVQEVKKVRRPAAAAVASLCLLLCGCDAQQVPAALEDARQRLAAAAGQAGTALAETAEQAMSDLFGEPAPAEQETAAVPEPAPSSQEAAGAQGPASSQEPADIPQTGAESTPAGTTEAGAEPPAEEDAGDGSTQDEAQSEGDEEDGVILEVSNILQNPELPNGCEITAATIVLNYLGFPVDKVTMAEQYLPQQSPYWAVDPDVAFMGNPAWLLAYYCNPQPVVQAVNAYLADQGSNYRAVDISGTPAEELYDWVAQGYPVVVWTTRGCTTPTYSTNFMLPDGTLPYSNSHCVVLTGFDSDGCYVADPMYEFSFASYEVFNWCYEARGSYAMVIVEQ